MTGSRDETLKRWSLEEVLRGIEGTQKGAFGGHLDTNPDASTGCGRDERALIALHSTHTVHAHDAEINSLAVSPNDALIASASLDNTIKVSPALPT